MRTRVISSVVHIYITSFSATVCDGQVRDGLRVIHVYVVHTIGMNHLISSISDERGTSRKVNTIYAVRHVVALILRSISDKWSGSFHQITTTERYKSLHFYACRIRSIQTIRILVLLVTDQAMKSNNLVPFVYKTCACMCWLITSQQFSKDKSFGCKWFCLV